MEYYRKLSDPDRENGVMRVWINGILIHEENGIQDQSSDNYDAGFMEFHWAPVFGGGYSSTNTCDDDPERACKVRDDFMRIGHLYISGIPR